MHRHIGEEMAPTITLEKQASIGSKMVSDNVLLNNNGSSLLWRRGMYLFNLFEKGGI